MNEKNFIFIMINFTSENVDQTFGYMGGVFDSFKPLLILIVAIVLGFAILKFIINLFFDLTRKKLEKKLVIDVEQEFGSYLFDEGIELPEFLELKETKKKKLFSEFLKYKTTPVSDKKAITDGFLPSFQMEFTPTMMSKVRKAFGHKKTKKSKKK